MKIAILGTGNVGMAIAANLSSNGHDVSLIKTSSNNSKSYDLLKENGNRIWLKENGKYIKTNIGEVTNDTTSIKDAEIVFVTIQSTYHEELIREISPQINSNQIVVIICSYMSSFYVSKYCDASPVVAETTGPYLEGRVELEDKDGEVVFRVGCRLTNSPLSISCKDKEQETESIKKLKSLYCGFNNIYSPIDSALLNPNLVIHTAGAIMSMPRIEYSDGDFCMYREAYSRKNKSTFNVMVELDNEKRSVLQKLKRKPVDVFDAGGFLGNKIESFLNYSESSNRAKSPTSIHSRYITEDVSQGLVLLESIGKYIGVPTPVTTALIELASVALHENFRENGRTIERLGAEGYINSLVGYDM